MPRKLTQEQFVEKANKVHNNFYDYNKAVYVNIRDKIRIICPIHGEFEQTAQVHLKGSGCSKCGENIRIIKSTLTTKEFINKAILIHSGKYDYSKTYYINANKKLIIICPIHGEFEQLASDHLRGYGCKSCYYDDKKSTTKQWVEKAKHIHLDKYDYSKVEYKRWNSKVCIICPIHGEFWQSARTHINGSGCPKCSESKGEKIISNWLDLNGINYISQYRFEDCKDKKSLSFDFYLPDHNMCIEYNGIQHYKPIEIFGGNEKLKNQKERDWIKMKYCLDNNIELIIIPYTVFNNIHHILENKINDK